VDDFKETLIPDWQHAMQINEFTFCRASDPTYTCDIVGYHFLQDEESYQTQYNWTVANKLVINNGTKGNDALSHFIGATADKWELGLALFVPSPFSKSDTKENARKFSRLVDQMTRRGKGVQIPNGATTLGVPSRSMYLVRKEIVCDVPYWAHTKPVLEAITGPVLVGLVHKMHAFISPSFTLVPTLVGGHL
jgi:hypothetical protein